MCTAVTIPGTGGHVRRNAHGDVERMHRTLLDEHFRVVGRSKWYEALEEMQADLQVYLKHYNEKRPHQGRGINGRTPYRVFKAGVKRTKPSMKKATERAA